MKFKHVAILGGGISGLSTAYFVRKLVASDIKVSLIEASPRVAGWIKTAKSPDGFLFEHGARGFRPSRNGSETLQLIKDLGLENQMCCSSKDANARFILQNNHVRKIPNTLMEFLQWRDSKLFFKALLKEPFVPPTQASDESIYDFIARRLDPEIAERFLDPMVSGIYGGDIRKLSLRACFQVLWEAEQEYGSLVKAMLQRPRRPDTMIDGTKKSAFVLENENHISVSFKNGMETLTQALVDQLENERNVQVLLDTQVDSLVPQSSGALTVVSTQKGKKVTLEVDQVVSMLPPNALAKVINGTSRTIVSELEQIPFESMATVHLGFNSQVVREGGFGYLVPSGEKQKILGTVYDSVTFPVQNSSENQTRLSVMSGGAHQPWISSLSEEELIQNAVKSTRDHLGITATPDYTGSVVLPNCIPQYYVGHVDRVDRIRRACKDVFPNLTVSGFGFDGIGISDRIAVSKEIALNVEKMY